MSYGEACWRQCCPIGSHLNFFWRVSRKNAKTGIFLHLVKLSEILLLHHISRVPPCESWRPDGSENVGLIGFLSFWTGVIAAQSRKKVKFSGPLAKIRGVTKKRHGHNFQNRGLKRIAGVVNPIDYPCYSFQTSNLKIVAVSFFWDAAFPCNFFLKFNSTLTAIHEDLNHQNHHVLHIFWKLRPCSFTWSYPG